MKGRHMTRRTLTTFVLVIALVLGSASPSFGLTRSEILARAQRWVDLGIPYSQTSWFEGYRQDCSGMASMSWKLWAPGPSTRSLAAYGVPITRDELQPGDMLLKYDYHAAIFYKWANGEHTWYWTLEESGSSGHAVSRLTKYPYWDTEGFTAYRPMNITEIDDYDEYVTQIAGSNRFNTAISASRRAFTEPTSTAVICSGENWPDALGGSALAGSLGSPILLTAATQVPSALRYELARLETTDIIVIGGPSSVSADVVQTLEDLPGIESVRRIGGRDRYETAALVASATVTQRRADSLTNDGGAYIATGFSFPDALGAATAAAHTGRPILLAQTSVVPSVTVDALEELEIDHAYIAGGTGALGEEIDTALLNAGVMEIDRFAGSDRYKTSLLLAEHAISEGLAWGGLAIATGDEFADALPGAVMQARLGSVLVLTPSSHLSASTDVAIRDHLEELDSVAILGGEAAVSPLARRQIKWIMEEP